MLTCFSTFWSLLTSLLVFGALFQKGTSECVLDVRNDLSHTLSPLVLKTDSHLPMDARRFLLPSISSDEYTFTSEEEAILLCSGPNNRIRLADTDSGNNVAVAKCSSGSRFMLVEGAYSLGKVACAQTPQSDIREAGRCAGGLKLLQVGFTLSPDAFVNQVDICYDSSAYRAFYVNYTLVEGIEKQHSGLPDPKSRADFFLSESAARRLYACGTKGTSREQCNYVKTELAPAKDFVLNAEQIAASQYYVNTAPVWRNYAQGNWRRLEEEIRQYGGSMNRVPSDLQIFTGTLGAATHSNGRQIKLANSVLVPQWIWKLVYEPEFKEAIVFIMLNNPYRMTFVPCSCVCAQTKWTKEWNRQDSSQGYIYCCKFQDFKRLYSNLPQLDVTGLLTKDKPYRAPFPDLEIQ